MRQKESWAGESFYGGTISSYSRVEDVDGNVHEVGD